MAGGLLFRLLFGLLLGLLNVWAKVSLSMKVVVLQNESKNAYLNMLVM